MDFYNRPTVEVAESLIGKSLCRRSSKNIYRHIITEVEAYDGPHDKACHASKGRTPRNAVMFGSAGHWYVYLCYGVHWMLNIVTGPEDYPAAVLIRGVGEWDGPGKLTKALSIDKALNTTTATDTSDLWVEDVGIIPNSLHIERTPRIGIGYAGEEWINKPWRFVLNNSP